MTQHGYPLLDLMLSDMESAPALYRPTHFWECGVSAILKDLLEYGVEQFRSFPSALSFFVPTYGYPGYVQNPEAYSGLRRALAEMNLKNPRLNMLLRRFLSGKLQALNDYRVCLASMIECCPYIDNASESGVGKPVEQFTFDGRRFSRSFLNYLLGLSFLRKYCDTSAIHTVLEIGGGYGTLGEILLGDPRNDCLYINVDIPPTSFISTYYLKQVFGETAVGDYGSLRGKDRLNIDDLRKKHRAVVLCPWQLPQLEGSVDLFVNFISFQEMEPEVVKNYTQHVSRLSSRLVLLRNLREGKKKAASRDSLGVLIPIKGKHYDELLSNYELIRVNTLPFGHKTVDGFHSELRAYARKD